MRVRFASTARTLTNSAAATSLFDRPAATNSATRSSVAVSSPATRATAHPRQLATGTIDPWFGAQGPEGHDCLVQRLASRALVLAATTHFAQDQQGARPLERQTESGERGDRRFETLIVRVVATRSLQQRATSRRDGNQRWALQQLTAAMQLVRQFRGPFEVANPDQRLDLVAGEGDPLGSLDAVLRVAGQQARGGFGIAARQLKEALCVPVVGGVRALVDGVRLRRRARRPCGSRHPARRAPRRPGPAARPARRA